MLEQLLALDTRWTLALNGSSSTYLDHLIMLITATSTWLPLAAVLLAVLYRNNRWRNFGLLILMVALCILLADQMASGIAKPYFERLRPSQDPALANVIDLVNGYKGGRYGFFSSHAANTFSVFVFLSCVFRYRPLTWLLLSWTLLNIYSRLYLGVHYVGDVLVGTLWGALVGYGVYRLYLRIKRPEPSANAATAQTSGYKRKDLQMFGYAILATYVIILIVALVQNLC